MRGKVMDAIGPPFGQPVTNVVVVVVSRRFNSLVSREEEWVKYEGGKALKPYSEEEEGFSQVSEG